MIPANTDFGVSPLRPMSASPESEPDLVPGFGSAESPENGGVKGGLKETLAEKRGCTFCFKVEEWEYVIRKAYCLI